MYDGRVTFRRNDNKRSRTGKGAGLFGFSNHNHGNTDTRDFGGCSGQQRPSVRRDNGDHTGNHKRRPRRQRRRYNNNHNNKCQVSTKNYFYEKNIRAKTDRCR